MILPALHLLRHFLRSLLSRKLHRLLRTLIDRTREISAILVWSSRKFEDMALVDSRPKVSSNTYPLGASLWRIPKLTRIQKVNPTARFLELPAEVHRQIASECPRPTLATLCRTSSLLRARYTTKLYEEIVFTCWLSDSCYHTQQSLFRTLRDRPEYASYVRNCTWSFVSLGSGSGSDPYSSCLCAFEKFKTEEMWGIFTLLTEVSSVEIRGLTLAWSDLINNIAPQYLLLFPKATSIAISGLLTNAVVHAVLPVSKASQLQHLCLKDNQVGSFRENRLEKATKILSRLTGKCTSLKSLVVEESEFNFLQPNQVRGAATASSVYIEFLESVRETLVIFCFDSEIHIIEGTERVLGIARSIGQFLKLGAWPHLQKVAFFPSDDSVSDLDEDGDSSGSAE